MTVCDLTDRHCEPCEGGVPPLDTDTAQAMMAQLHGDWVLDAQLGEISREIKVRTFARAMQIANVAGFIGEQEGHHPDIAFGWGYCRIKYTTHAINGLSENDFICAAKTDRAVDMG